MFRRYKALGACAVEMATETTGNDAEDVSDGEMKTSVSTGIKSGYGDEVNVTDMEADPVGLKVNVGRWLVCGGNQRRWTGV